MHDGPGDAPVESIHSAAASAHISHAVIATYAAAAAIEVAGVHAIAGAQPGGVDPDRVPKGVDQLRRRRRRAGAAPRHRVGGQHPGRGRRGQQPRARLPGVDDRTRALLGGGRDRRRRAARIMTGVEHLNGATVGVAPVPCRDCMWWQTRPAGKPGDRRRWKRELEDDFGPWGKLYVEDDRVIGLIQYGPSDRFARARHLPAGPPGRDAVLVTCAYLTDAHSPWVLQSLFLAAIGECRDRGLPALEAFGNRFPPDEGFAARFLGHRTIFPADFLR